MTALHAQNETLSTKYAQKCENRPPKFGLMEPCMAASASLELLATANGAAERP